MTIVLVALFTAAAPLTCLLMWNRLGPHRWVRSGARAALLVLCQGLAVLLAGLLLNKQYAFYTSWSEVFGKAALTTATTRVGALHTDRMYRLRLRAAYLAAHGTVVPWVVPAPNSGLPPQRALVYLPAAYGNPAYADVRFPVVELLEGVPSTPQTWLGPLQLQGVLDGAIAHGQSQPFIAIIPTQNVLAPRDTECVNVANGPQVDTYLTADVHRSIVGAFRAETGTAGWAAMGYSTGGYCAINLAMRHPDLYSAAVAMSGYDEPAHDSSTGNLFGGNSLAESRNTPLWEARHWPGHPLTILAIASRHDKASYGQTVQLTEAAHPPLLISDILLARGGHNAKLWVAMEPVAFNWLSQRLRPALAGVTIRADLLSPRQLVVRTEPLPRSHSGDAH